MQFEKEAVKVSIFRDDIIVHLSHFKILLENFYSH